MSANPRLIFVAATLLFPVLAIAPQGIRAQTPSQMEYERQQREYWRQQEQQRQEQQRQQQLMNENARRQQEESSRLNAPTGQLQRPPIRALHRSRLRGAKDLRWTSRPRLRRRSGRR